MASYGSRIMAGENARRSALAAAVRRQKAPAIKKPAPKPAAPAIPAAPVSDPSRPRFTPGALDEDGVRSRANLDFSYQTDSRGVQQSYDDTMADINAQRPQIDKQRDKGYLDADKNVAGRGFGRSGIRSQYRTEVGEGADEAHRQLSNAAIRAANARQQGLDSLTGQYRTGLTNLTVDSNQRQRELFDERNPMTVSVPPSQAATKRPAAKSYAEFLGGRKSTSALAKQWDKQFNYGQRFG